MNAAAAPTAAAEWLRRKLHLGARAEDFAQLREALGLPQGADELALARGLLEQIGRHSLSGVALGGAGAHGHVRGDDSRIVVDGRASFLMRLTTGGSEASVDIARITDLRTLTAVLRAGNLRQRRAATRRLGELLAQALFTGDAARDAIDALAHPRALSTAYEAFSVIASLPGAEGRRARAEGQRWEALRAQLEAELPRFWEGELPGEPVMSLPDDERVQLLLRTRDLSDDLVRHLSAVVGGGDGVADRRARAALIGALQHAGDPRLLPVLRAVLIEGDSELFAAAARALGHIDDPRARTALRQLYDRTSAPEQRLLLAGALGLTGEPRGLRYVREVLAKGDDRLLRLALAALSELGGYDDVQAVTELLTQREPALVLAAVQTLARIGDARALSPLAELSRNAKSSGLRAEIEDAQDAISARMELLGEEPPAPALSAHSFDTAKRVALVKRKDPAAVRVRALFAYVMGQFWLSVGAFGRALSRLEAASALRPDWVAPVLSVAMAYARRNESAQALASFRRALGIDQKAVENHRAPVRMLAHCFLRRAEAMVRDGREDIARGLLEEALSIDLRKAPSDLRFAIEQRLHALEVKAA